MKWKALKSKIALVTLFCAATASANDNFTFYVDVSIERPAIMAHATGDLRARDPVDTNRIDWVSASFQLVEIYQSHWSGPQFCGQVYTDSNGRIPAGTSFTCGPARPVSIQLLVRGESSRGFRVGITHPLPYMQLSDAIAFEWASVEEEFPASGNRISFSDIRLGELIIPGAAAVHLRQTRFQSPRFRAAALFELLDFLYQQLNLGFQHQDPTRRWVVLYSKWITNDLASGILQEINDLSGGLLGERVPWTFWDTVHLPPNTSTEVVLSSAAHELGHILYNLYHSRFEHYYGEVWEYIKNHEPCLGNSYRFASYEGFAHAVSNLVWAHHDSAYAIPQATCPTNLNSLRLEGNVNEFYSAAIAGDPMERPLAALDNWTTHRIGDNEYAFPPTLGLLDIISSAGMNAEDLSSVWDASMNDFCSTTHNGAPAFCGTRRFKCMVNTEMLSPVDPISPEFRPPSADCQPGIASISQIHTRWFWPRRRVTVEFTHAEFVDEYSIVWQATDGQSGVIRVVLNDAQVRSATSIPNSTYYRHIRVPKCQRISFRVATQNQAGSTQGPITEVGPLGRFCGNVGPVTVTTPPIGANR